MSTNTRAWLRGLFAAAINAASSAVILIIADPAVFNFESPTKLFMTTGAFTILAVANYLKQHPLPEESVTVETTVTHKGGPPPAAVIFLALAIGAGSIGCAGAHSAPINLNPTATQVAQTQKDVIRAIEATTSALKIANVAVLAADELNKAKVLPADVTKTIATAGLAFANTADLALQEMERVGTEPNLAATAKRLIGLLDPFLKTLEDSKSEKLQAFASSLRIGMSIVRTFGG
jgi:hypothetical protein